MHKRRSRIALLLGALIALVSVGLLAGCGSAQEKNDYVDQVNKIQQEALDAVNKATANAPSNAQEFEQQIGSAGDAVDDALTKLKDVDVPDDAKDGHQQFINALSSMSDVFHETANKVKGASPSELITVVTSLQTKATQAGTKIDSAISKINDELGASG